MNSTAAKRELETLDDVALVERVVHHDMPAFETLMRRYNRLLYRTARGVLRDDHEAEDCVQEAYLHAYQRIGSFRHEARLSTWLVRIAVNEALQKLRKRRAESTHVPLDNVIDIDAHLAPMASLGIAPRQPDADVLRGQWRTLMEEKIDRLPETFRVVFILRAIEELSVEETAACLQIPVATVRTRFFRARALLREAIAREFDRAMEDVFEFMGERCDRIVANVLKRIEEAPGAQPSSDR